MVHAGYMVFNPGVEHIRNPQQESCDREAFRAD